MRSVLIGTLVVAALVATTPPAAAQLKVSISGEPREEINTVAYADRYSTLAYYVGTTTGS